MVLYLSAFLAVLVACLGATGLALRVLHRRAILDHPNVRSSHAVPTPRGGGIAVMAVLLPAWAIIAALATPRLSGMVLIIACAGALAVVSWIDDLRRLSPWSRLAAQAAAVLLSLFALPEGGLVFQGLLPFVADRIAAAVLWLWFVNLFNFMDGIDGIAGAEAACLGAGLFALAVLFPESLGAAPGLDLLALTLAAAALGFLWWNWEPAKIFLGDVGSVPLGFLLGFLLLAAAAAGQWAAALILPLYYLADATATLARRLAAGEPIWQAHARHFYQRAVRKGRTHAAVVRAIVVADLALIGLGLAAAAGYPLAALLGGAAVTALLLFHLGRAPPAGRHP